MIKGQGRMPVGALWKSRTGYVINAKLYEGQTADQQQDEEENNSKKVLLKWVLFSAIHPYLVLS